MSTRTWKCHTPHTEPGLTIEYTELLVSGSWHGTRAQTYVELPDGSRIEQKSYGGNADTTVLLSDGSSQWTGHDFDAPVSTLVLTLKRPAATNSLGTVKVDSVQSDVLCSLEFQN
jgi:hypothetical protein